MRDWMIIVTIVFFLVLILQFVLVGISWLFINITLPWWLWAPIVASIIATFAYLTRDM
jgi:uncharacterized membrane protein YbhN (UPF0104 family)